MDEFLHHVIAREHAIAGTLTRGNLAGKMSTAAQLLVGGERTSGESIRSQNGAGNINRIHTKNFHLHCISFSDGCPLSGQYCQDFPRTCGSGQNAGG